MAGKKTKIGRPPRDAAENGAPVRERILDAAAEHFAENGFAGARIDGICQAAAVSPRMIYHYYGDKSGLYVAVLESMLAELRAEELKLRDDDAATALDGLLNMFDFIYGHFGRRPGLVKMLAGENLMQAQFLKSSVATPLVASSVLDHIKTLLAEGKKDATIVAEVDPLHLYAMMVALCYFHRSNGYTFTHIFKEDVLAGGWQQDHQKVARRMLRAFLVNPD